MQPTEQRQKILPFRHQDPAWETPRETRPALVLSSDPDFLSEIRNLLKDGDRIEESAAVESAVAALKEKDYACVLIDDALADDGALFFLKKIYDPETDLCAAPCVIITGKGRESRMLAALRRGAQDCVAREHLTPFSLNVALSKAKEIFELKSSRWQAELQLRRNSRMEAVGQLTSGVAHDFNNLLTVILGNARLARRRLQKDSSVVSPEELEKKIEMMESAAVKGADLVRRLMVFTRQSELSEEITNINECISETFELLERTLGETIAVEVIPVENPWPISLDAREFENALINLAVNARDAMPRGGKLTIETGNVMLDEAYALSHPDVAAGPYVLISISDTGMGMDQETLKRIFEPFFTTKETGKGTGLGLSMVYGFIRQSKGHIQVYSEPGHGTVFRIYLPRVRVEEDALPAADSQPVPEGGESILVAEDDEDVRIMASNMLEKLGYKTLLAENGRVALEILKKEHKKIDLVFTDIVMPGGMSGIELVQRVREYYPGVKVLYTSGYSENAIPDYQLSVGEELISKPYRREALARKVRKVLDAKGE